MPVPYQSDVSRATPGPVLRTLVHNSLDNSCHHDGG